MSRASGESLLRLLTSALSLTALLDVADPLAGGSVSPGRGGIPPWPLTVVTALANEKRWCRVRCHQCKAPINRLRARHDRAGGVILGLAVEFTQPQGGLFFWARLTGADGKTKDACEFAKRAIAQGVAFVPGAPFYANNPDVSTFRLSFATADVGKIEEGGGMFD